jgi:hypothetical protein
MMSESDSLRNLPTVAITSMILDDNQKLRLAKASSIVSKQDLTTETLIGAIREAVGVAHPP